MSQGAYGGRRRSNNAEAAANLAAMVGTPDRQVTYPFAPAPGQPLPPGYPTPANRDVQSSYPPPAPPPPHPQVVYVQAPPPPVQYVPYPVRPRWSPGVAAILSFFLPGLGQMYKGQVFNGLVWLIVVAIGYAAFVVPGLVLHICCIVGAASGDPYR